MAVWSALSRSDRVLFVMLGIYPILATARAWIDTDDLLRILWVVVILGSVERKQPVQEAKAWASSFAGPAGMLAIAFTGYVFLSLAWTTLPRDFNGLHLFKTAWIFVAATVIGKRLVLLPLPRFHLWFAAATAFALLAFLIDAQFDHPLIEFYYGEPIARRINPNAIALSLLLWPALAGLWLFGRRIAAGILWLLAGVSLSFSSSEASVVGYLIGTAMLAVAWILPRVAVWIAWAAAAAGSLFVIAWPWLATIITRLLPEQFAYHAATQDRIDVWSEQVPRIFETPFLGHGALFLGRSHSHNFPIQIWVELGFVGVVLVVALMFAGALAVRRLPDAVRPFMLACCAAVFLNAYVGYGMWELQFISILIVPILILLHGARSAQG